MDKMFERLNQIVINSYYTNISYARAFIAQSGERQTEDLVVPGSIPGEGTQQTHFYPSFAKSRLNQLNLFQSHLLNPI